MTLRSLIVSDVTDVFLNVNEFAETITIVTPYGLTYTPLAVVSDEDTVRALSTDIRPAVTERDSGIQITFYCVATILDDGTVDFTELTSKLHGMRVTAAGLVYSVEYITRPQGAIELYLYRTGMRERSREGYRKR